MQRSVAKILTTHVGSLPFLSLDRGLAAGDQTHLDEDVAAIVAHQRDIGLDIINEGEYAKGGDWLRYMQNRFGGFTDIAPDDEKPLIERGKDREEFADVLQILDRARHAVLCAGRADRQEAPGPGLHRAGRLCRPGRA
jgi:5-methyltetrahydropteroyltriglutamate--homocysteine methyltransferase